MDEVFAVGHIALGYLINKVISRGKNASITAIWTLSLLPDIDLIIPFLRHRGPTHSMIIPIAIFLPLLIARKREAVPYFAAMVTHSVIGDIFTGGGIQLFWPISSDWISSKIVIRMGTAYENYMEITLFAALIGTIILTRDYTRLFNSDKKNTILFIPLCTIVLPAMFKIPIAVPKILVLPHVIMMAIILLSISMPLIPSPEIHKVKTT